MIVLVSNVASEGRQFELNECEKAFVDHMSRSGIEGIDFQRLTNDVFEGEFGGQGDALLRNLSPEALEVPSHFATEVYKKFGMEALRYFVMIVKYVDSGRFHPEEEAEDEAVEEDLESIVNEVESNSGQGVDGEQSA